MFVSMWGRELKRVGIDRDQESRFLSETLQMTGQLTEEEECLPK